MAGEEGQVQWRIAKQKEAVEETEEAAAAVSTEGEKHAADATAEAAAADGEDESGVVEWVEMPKEYLAWLLAQTRETRSVPTIGHYYDPSMSPEDVGRRRELICKMNARLQALDDQFFRFQAWVCDKLQRNGRVMVPADIFGRTPEVQQEVNEIWEDEMKKQLGMEVDADCDPKEDVEAVLPSN